MQFLTLLALAISAVPALAQNERCTAGVSNFCGSDGLTYYDCNDGVATVHAVCDAASGGCHELGGWTAYCGGSF